MKSVCTKCGDEKEQEEFPIDKRKKNGLSSWCRKCHYFNWRIIYKGKKLADYRERDRERAKNRRVNNPGYKTKEYTKYRQKFPEKVKAQQLLNQAIRQGKIKRSPCEVCGEKRKYRVHAHHDDYKKPLEVRFLCSIHHKQSHQKINQELT